MDSANSNANPNGRKHQLIRRVWFLLLALIITGASPIVIAQKFFQSSPGTEAAAAVSPVKTQQTPAQQPKTAEQVYKNIQVLKGMPAAELEPTMAFISGSLGVKCNHCHVNPFEKDEKPTKSTARRMMRMVLDLNKGSFNGEKAVSCFTCHRGKPHPVSVPAVGQNLWQPNAA